MSVFSSNVWLPMERGREAVVSWLSCVHISEPKIKTDINGTLTRSVPSAKWNVYPFSISIITLCFQRQNYNRLDGETWWFTYVQLTRASHRIKYSAEGQLHSSHNRVYWFKPIGLRKVISSIQTPSFYTQNWGKYRLSKNTMYDVIHGGVEEEIWKFVCLMICGKVDDHWPFVNF